MTPEQRYLFDINGYLHLPNVLSASELAAAQPVQRRRHRPFGGQGGVCLLGSST